MSFTRRTTASLLACTLLAASVAGCDAPGDDADCLAILVPRFRDEPIAPLAGTLLTEQGLGYYNGSKAAVVHLSRQLAAELSPKVRVNCVSAGLILTGCAWTVYAAVVVIAFPASILSWGLGATFALGAGLRLVATFADQHRLERAIRETS